VRKYLKVSCREQDIAGGPIFNEYESIAKITHCEPVYLGRISEYSTVNESWFPVHWEHIKCYLAFYMWKITNIEAVKTFCQKRTTWMHRSFNIYMYQHQKKNNREQNIPLQGKYHIKVS
jgi:hypothetical protein